MIAARDFGISSVFQYLSKALASGGCDIRVVLARGAQRWRFDVVGIAGVIRKYSHGVVYEPPCVVVRVLLCFSYCCSSYRVQSRYAGISVCEQLNEFACKLFFVGQRVMHEVYELFSVVFGDIWHCANQAHGNQPVWKALCVLNRNSAGVGAGN